jgi:hypothetical protein
MPEEAVMSFRSDFLPHFLGIGAHLVVVPYDSLVLDETGSKVELSGATKEQLKGLSQFHYQS